MDLLARQSHFRNNREIFFITLPGVLYTLLFAYVPMIGIIIAFKKYRYDEGIFGSEWVGWSNFEFLFASSDAWRIIRNTIGYNLVYTITVTVSALLFALLLNEIRQRFVKVYQTVLFLPYFISTVLVGYIVYAFLEANNGYLNRVLESFGLPGRMWYAETKPWLFILPTVNLWHGVGFATLVYYAGIMGIGSDYYEAAKLDGASRIQMMYRITLPLLTPLIMILLILSIGNMIRGDFGLHYFVPQNSTLVLSTTDIIDTYVVRALQTIGDVGMSAAVGFFQSVTGLILVITANAIVRKINDENSLF